MAVVIGADPKVPTKRPLFELVSASQTILPKSKGLTRATLREVGLSVNIQKDMPTVISKNIENALVNAFAPVGIDD
jgi:chalcone synthase